MNELRKVKIYSDGSSKGASDGPGGYGTIVQYVNDDGTDGDLMEYTDGFKITTNNRMELLAVIVGLESLNEPCDVMVYSDSKYVVDAFNQRWIFNWLSNGWRTSLKKPVKNIDLWKRLLDAMKPHECRFAWVKGHDGHADNERCDYLAQASSDGVEFIRQEDGTLIPKNTLKEDVKYESKETEINECDIFEIMRDNNISSIELKNDELYINGVKYVYDEEGNISPTDENDSIDNTTIINFLKLLINKIENSSFTITLF